jgi:WD40 repeat protein
MIDAPIIEQTDYVNYNCKGTFTGHSGPVWGLAVTDDGLLVSGSSDTTIKIWDVANLKCKQVIILIILLAVLLMMLSRLSLEMKA